MRATASVRHKHIRIDQAKLDKARKVLAAATETEALDRALTIVNDVLIALSARSIGATVVTQNESHYRAIQAIRPFRLVVVH